MNGNGPGDTQTSAVPACRHCGPSWSTTADRIAARSHGTIVAVGPDVRTTDFAPGDDVFYSGSPIRPGSNAEFQLVDSRSVAKKPTTLDFVEAAAMPLTYITAYEALVERMEIRRGERAGLLIVNGSGGNVPPSEDVSCYHVHC